VLEILQWGSHWFLHDDLVFITKVVGLCRVLGKIRFYGGFDNEVLKASNSRMVTTIAPGTATQKIFSIAPTLSAHGAVHFLNALMFRMWILFFLLAGASLGAKTAIWTLTVLNFSSLRIFEDGDVVGPPLLYHSFVAGPVGVVPGLGAAVVCHGRAINVIVRPGVAECPHEGSCTSVVAACT
jgi:hypothetical protein